MAYAKSIDVRVYPTAWRGANASTSKTFNPEASLNTEENLANLSNRLAKLVTGSSRLDCFVVSYAGNKAVIVLHGYIFEINNVSSLGSPLWAKIQVVAEPTTYRGRDFDNPTLACFDNGSPNPAVAVLDIKDGAGTADDDYFFHGLQFSSTEVTSDSDHGIYALQILDDNGAVPAESWLILDTTQVQDTVGIPLAQAFHTSSIYASSISTNSLSANSIFTASINASSLLISTAGTAVIGDVVPSGSFNLGASSAHWQSIYGTNVYADGAAAGVFSLIPGGSLYAQIYASNSTNIHLNISSGANFKVWAGSIYANMKYASIAMYGADVTMSGATINATSDISVLNSAASGNINLSASVIHLMGETVINDMYASTVYASSVNTRLISSTAELYINAHDGFGINTSKTGSVYGAGYEIDMESSGGTIIYDNGPNRTVTVTASNISLIASYVTLGATAAKTKLTTNSVGNSTTPIYLSAGTPKACSLVDYKGGDVFMGWDSSYLSNSSNIAIAQSGSSISDIESSSLNWSAFNSNLTEQAQGSVCLEYMLIGDILKVALRIKNINNIFSRHSTYLSGCAIRISWDWLVARTIGSSYQALTSGNSVWHNSALMNIDYRDLTQSTSLCPHVAQDYVYFDIDGAPASSYEVCLNCEVTLHVRKDS